MYLYNMTQKPGSWPSDCLEWVRLVFPCLSIKFMQLDKWGKQKTDLEP